MRHSLLPTISILLSLGPASLHAQNLLLNPGFDDNLTGWSPGFFVTATHSELDVAGDQDSGSARVTNVYPDPGFGDGIRQCVRVTAGTSYDFGAWFRIPSGQAQTGPGLIVVSWYTSTNCAAGTRISPGTAVEGAEEPTDAWVLLQRLAKTAPGGARSARFLLAVDKEETGGGRTMYFDDARFCRSGTCALSIGPILSSAEIPDFRFQVTIEAGGEAFPGILEPTCLAETICVSGALPGRTEAQLRVIGPRPNGYLWFQVVRFTPSRVVVLVQQISTGVVRSYVLEAVKPGKKPTNLEDRVAFLP